jgi:hypothetical protein
MPWPEYSAVLQQQFMPMFLAILFLSLITSLIALFITKEKFSKLIGSCLPFGFLGGTAGLIAGASAEPIVGALLTGMLGIISALLTLLFAKETLKQWQAFIPVAITLLCLSALAGLSIGKVHRSQWTSFDRNYQRWLLEHEKVHLELMKTRKRHQLCIELSSTEDRSKCANILLTPG